jgi:hypothetical protein
VRNLSKAVLVTLLAVGLVACVAGSGDSHHAAEGGPLSQLLLGFWHGLIGPLTLAGEIINKVFPHLLPWSVRFYEPQATSVLYDSGFFFGLLGGPSFLWAGSWRRR